MAVLLVLMLLGGLVQTAAASQRRAWDRPSLQERRSTMWNRAEARSNVLNDPVVDAVTENFEVVGHLAFKGATPDADVALYDHGGRAGQHAYVGTWGNPCAGKGLKIVRTKYPRHPKLVARAGAFPGTSSEDMVVTRIGNRDILAIGIQPCGDRGVGGLALYNVTTPSRPKLVDFMRQRPFGVHELDVAVRPDGRVLALLASNWAETDVYFGGPPAPGDFRIVDITRPANPMRLSAWGALSDGRLNEFDSGDVVDAPFEGLGYFAAQFAHSARAADDGMTAYVSYWDSGVLKFDLTDPADPVLVGRTAYPANADGDAHSVVPIDIDGERYLYTNDEDFAPQSVLTVTSNATGNEAFSGVELFWMPSTFSAGGELSGEVHDAGDGCQAADYEGAEGMIALVDLVEFGTTDNEPPCAPDRQILLASASGASALLINWISPHDPNPYPPPEEIAEPLIESNPDMPVAAVSANDGLADAIRSRPGSAPVQLTITPEVPTWGFLRIFQESSATDINGDGVVEFEQVGQFSDLPNVTGEGVLNPGEWSIHNTEILGSRAYSSWYSHGIVALDLTDPTAPVKVGQFRRPSHRKSATFGPESFPSTWGVEIDPANGLIYSSDMRSGLWILRPTGAAAAGG